MYQVIRSFVIRNRKLFLASVSTLFIVVVTVPLALLLRDPPGIAAGIEEESLRYTQLPEPLERVRPNADFALPTDATAVDPKNREALLHEFDNVFVKKGVLTDCSFTSAFMLLYDHDVDYPYKVLRSNADGSYVVSFPGYGREMLVTPEAISKFNAYVQARETWKSYFKGGHTVPGIDILRNAYYDYRRKSDAAGDKYRVYGGGVPINDLLMLSGVARGYIIRTVREDTGFSFADDEEIGIEINISEGEKKYRVTDGPREFGNPLNLLGDLSNYMIALSSAKVVDNSFGTHIIANHAYYLRGTTADGKYVLGNSYNTKKVILLDEMELLNKFAAVHYIEIYR
ncbi:MAG: hypothetical protein AB2598_06140 [Candidatus Thiodiazotropha sp.]